MTYSWLLIIFFNNSFMTFGEIPALWNLHISQIESRMSCSKPPFQLGTRMWPRVLWVNLIPKWIARGNRASIELLFYLAFSAVETSSFQKRDDLLLQKWHWCWQVARKSSSYLLLLLIFALIVAAALSWLRQSYFSV